jgi:hypothetical protein
MIGNYATMERAYSSRKINIEGWRNTTMDRVLIGQNNGAEPGIASKDRRSDSQPTREHATSLGRMSDARFHF